MAYAFLLPNMSLLDLMTRRPPVVADVSLSKVANVVRECKARHRRPSVRRAQAGLQWDLRAPYLARIKDCAQKLAHAA
jgi:hypothetical protein